MNLWGHRFSKNANRKLPGFLLWKFIGKAEILGWYFGRNNDLANSFWIRLTFKRWGFKQQPIPKLRIFKFYHCLLFIQSIFQKATNLLSFLLVRTFYPSWFSKCIWPDQNQTMNSMKKNQTKKSGMIILDWFLASREHDISSKTFQDYLMQFQYVSPHCELLHELGASVNNGRNSPVWQSIKKADISAKLHS